MSMTLLQLHEKLSKMIEDGVPVDTIVIVQKDSEGNGYSPLAEVDADAVYKAATTWHGEVYSTYWSHMDACFDSEQEWAEFKRNTPRCVVLAPVN